MPSVVTTRTPLLLPNFDTPFAISPPSEIDMRDNLGEIQGSSIFSGNVKGSGTITVTNAGTAGDTVTVTLTGFPSGFSATTGPIQATPTTTTTATAIALAINSSTSLSQVIYATSAAAVVTIKAVRPGPLSDFAYTTSTSGSTFASTNVAMTGAAGNMVTPLEVIVVAYGRNVFELYPFRPFAADAGLVAILQASGKLVV